MRRLRTEYGTDSSKFRFASKFSSYTQLNRSWPSLFVPREPETHRGRAVTPLEGLQTPGSILTKKKPSNSIQKRLQKSGSISNRREMEVKFNIRRQAYLFKTKILLTLQMMTNSTTKICPDTWSLPLHVLGVAKKSYETQSKNLHNIFFVLWGR